MGRSRRSSAWHGVLLVDKPGGPTSHDMVARARRIFGTRRIGHTGTLDPMATGLLVLALGECTKLVPFLTGHSKRYRATIALGAETDTLDAEGAVVERCAVPHLDTDSVQDAMRSYLGEHDQRAPAVSAIKVDGVPLHRQVRMGVQVEPPVRRVLLHEARVLGCQGDHIEVELHSGAGFYVRSFGRDLARTLGTRGHLTELRRLACGPFQLAEATSAAAFQEAVSAEPGEEARERLLARLLSPMDACRGMSSARLSAKGALDVFHGRPIGTEDVLERHGVSPEPVALLGPEGDLRAIGRCKDGGGYQVIRGIRPGEPSGDVPT